MRGIQDRFGPQSILGAYMAVVGLIDKHYQSHPSFRVKLEASGQDLLSTLFCVTSGRCLDLSGLVESPSALAPSA